METSYQKIIRCGNDELKKDVRTEIAIYAHDHGIAKTVEDYNIVKNTARKWRDRYRRGEPMTDRSRKPERQPNQIAPYWRCLIIDKAEIEIARLQAQRANNSKPIVISASWLQKEYRIPYSQKTILKVLHEEGLKRVNPHKTIVRLSRAIFRQQTMSCPISAHYDRR